MTRIYSRLLALGGVTLLLILLAPFGGMAGVHAQTMTLSSAKTTVLATGLDSPRGLTFGPDGNLYVAEGGQGGSQSTVGQCQQVPPPVGPYMGGMTGRISQVSPAGVRSTVVDHLPSNQTGPGVGSDPSGVAAVVFIGHTLYALLAGAGCSHGVPGKPNAVLRIDRGQHVAYYIANLSHFLMTHPVANPNPGDFEPDGTWYSMVAVGHSLYALEPNHGELDKITPQGSQDDLDDSTISRVVDISASQGHAVPTAITFHNGNFYAGNIDELAPGAAHLYKITPTGAISILFSGLTMVLGVAFDRCGQLYALEGYTGDQPAPGTGAVVRLTKSGTMQTVATGLTFPSAMTFGSDGNLYVSNFGFTLGFSFPAHSGQIVRIATHGSSCD